MVSEITIEFLKFKVYIFVEKYQKGENMKQLKERFDTLSDAIIAIVMTILVLEIAVPATNKDLPQLFEGIALFW